MTIIDPPYDPEFDGEDPPPDWPFSPEWQERRAYHRPPFEPVVGLWDESLSECDWYSYVVLP